AIVVAPGFAHELFGAGAVAFGEERTREHVVTLGGHRLLVGKEREDRGVVELVVPQGILGAAAEQRGVRPARIGGDETGVALEAWLGVVAAQDDPFGKLARDRIGDRLFRSVCVAVLAL